MTMTTSQRGRALIKQFEDFRADAYQDVVGVWTIGYGFTHGVKPGQRMTAAQAEARLTTELLEYERAVLAACKIGANQNQFDALVSLAWNIGAPRLATSTVIKAHNRGDYTAAARAFNLWNKAGGKEWPGLTRRRAAEAALYLEPVAVPVPVEEALPVVNQDPRPAAQPMPQAVDRERGMAESGINRAATVAGTTAAGLGALSQIKDALTDLQGWLVPGLCFAVVTLAAYIVWQRVEQRRKGWA